MSSYKDQFEQAQKKRKELEDERKHRDEERKIEEQRRREEENRLEDIKLEERRKKKNRRVIEAADKFSTEITKILQAYGQVHCSGLDVEVPEEPEFWYAGDDCQIVPDRAILISAGWGLACYAPGKHVIIQVLLEWSTNTLLGQRVTGFKIEGVVGPNKARLSISELAAVLAESQPAWQSNETTEEQRQFIDSLLNANINDNMGTLATIAATTPVKGVSDTKRPQKDQHS